MSENKQHLAFDLEFSHIVREIFIPVTMYASPASTEGKYIKINALWDTGATLSVITPKIAEELNLEPFDKYIISGINDKGKLSDVVLSTITLPNNMTFLGQRFSVCEIPGADALIGMDIISRGDCVITTARGKTLFSFVIPTLNEKISFSKTVNNQ